MEKIGSIEIRVSGIKGKIVLSPDNYDVKEIISMLQNVEDLLYSENKKERPVISIILKKDQSDIFSRPVFRQLLDLVQYLFR